MQKIIYAEESYKILGCCFEVHNQLGCGFLEAVYKDALEVEFNKRNIFYEREKKYPVIYKDDYLLRKYFADFVVYDKIILEVKAADKMHDVFWIQARII